MTRLNKSKKGGKYQESIQSSTMIPHGNVTKTQLNISKNEGQEVITFPAGDHKAAMNRRESMTNT